MGAYTSLATLGLNLALSQRAERADAKRLEKDRDRQLKEIMGNDAEARRQQQETLKRRLAEERARAGAAGVGGSGGSADAILRGLEEESQALQAAQGEASARKIAAVRQATSEKKHRNLMAYTSRWLNAGSGAAGGSGRSLLD